MKTTFKSAAQNLCKKLHLPFSPEEGVNFVFKNPCTFAAGTLAPPALALGVAYSLFPEPELISGLLFAAGGFSSIPFLVGTIVVDDLMRNNPNSAKSHLAHYYMSTSANWSTALMGSGIVALGSLVATESPTWGQVTMAMGGLCAGVSLVMGVRDCVKAAKFMPLRPWPPQGYLPKNKQKLYRPAR